ncbi:Hypothetical protein SRAE_2000499700 [Strongyloides ratti]|uniref:Uncharacterized protein n=1 Tax=Strongyloides ratti TaxID=34506 RepID=A0A090LQA5_STRRB|nr:Hypothetical protein SRAE_2000499700 [Strongyloides ratti]CEF70364.2 Hypothetical protein SRAE_2000499700 [Strongyloides ratti]
MKYLIPLYFILFISFITIINVNSAKKTPKKPTKKTTTTTKKTTTSKKITPIVKSFWKPLRVPLTGKTATTLGKRGVEYYNKQHKNENLTYINVTEGERCGHISTKNRKIRVTVLVRKTSTGKKGNASCNYLRAVFSEFRRGKIDIILVKLLNKEVKGNCDIKGKDKESQKTTKKPTNKTTKKSTKSKSNKSKKKIN